MEAAERDAAVVVTPGLGEGGVLHLAGATAGRGRIPRGTRRGGHVTRGDREDSKSVCTVCGATEHTSTECRYRKFEDLFTAGLAGSRAVRLDFGCGKAQCQCFVGRGRFLTL
ncbi:hypothetical protein ACJJTC_011456 [Scirpophaga incertulas]